MCNVLIPTLPRTVQSLSSTAAQPVTLMRCSQHGNVTQIQYMFLGEHIFVTWKIGRALHLKPSSYLQV